MHLQSEINDIPSIVWNVPAGQSLHWIEPNADEYFPARHSEQFSLEPMAG
jgi:hypothetical protein